MHPLAKNCTLILLLLMQCFSVSTLANNPPSQTSISLAQQMYVAYYGRPGDSAGIEYWAEKFDESDNLEDVLAAFGNSKEYTDNYGTLSEEALINGLFLQMFNRDSDDQGLDFYTSKLQSGEVTRISIAKQIADGAGFFDKETFDNKVSASNKYTYYATSGITSYSSDEISTVSKLLTEVTYTEETKNIFLKKVDFWIATGYQTADLYCEEILRNVFNGNLQEDTYNDLFTEALAYRDQSSWCQAALAYLYQKGRGVTTDIKLSLEFAQASADQDNPAGQTILGEKYFIGNGVTLDTNAALNYFSSAAAQDYWRGFYSLGRYYLEPASLDEDLAYQYFQRAYQASVDSDYTSGKVEGYLGKMHFFGKGVAQSYEKALGWWYEGAHNGDAWSQEWLGYLYETGTYTATNINQAIYWYQLAADQNIEHMTKKVEQLIDILEQNASGTGGTLNAGNTADRYTEIPIPDLYLVSNTILMPDAAPNNSPSQFPDTILPTDDNPTTNTASDAGNFPDSEEESSATKTSLNITWNRPTSRSNGDSLAREEIARYTLYYYRQGQALVQASLDANNFTGNSQLHYTTEPLAPGTYFFSIDCVDINGLHSEKSDLVSIQVH